MSREAGQVLRALRANRGLTQAQLGELLGCSETDMKLIERGQQAFSRDFASRLALALDLTVSETDRLFRAADLLGRDAGILWQTVEGAIRLDERLSARDREILLVLHAELGRSLPRSRRRARGGSELDQKDGPGEPTEAATGSSASKSAPTLDLERLLTVNEVAEVLRCCPKTVRRLVAEGEVGSVRMGRSLRIAQSQLTKYMERLMAERNVPKMRTARTGKQLTPVPITPKSRRSGGGPAGRRSGGAS